MEISREDLIDVLVALEYKNAATKDNSYLLAYLKNRIFKEFPEDALLRRPAFKEDEKLTVHLADLLAAAKAGKAVTVTGGDLEKGKPSRPRGDERPEVKPKAKPKAREPASGADVLGSKPGSKAHSLNAVLLSAEGPLTVGEIRELAGVDPPVAGHLNALMKKDLLVRSGSGRDIRYALSKEGKKLRLKSERAKEKAEK